MRTSDERRGGNDSRTGPGPIVDGPSVQDGEPCCSLNHCFRVCFEVPNEWPSSDVIDVIVISVTRLLPYRAAQHHKALSSVLTGSSPVRNLSLRKGLSFLQRHFCFHLYSFTEELEVELERLAQIGNSDTRSKTDYLLQNSRTDSFIRVFDCRSQVQ